MTRTLRHAAVALLAFLMVPVATPTSALAQEASAKRTTPYYQGRTRLALNGGVLSNSNDTTFLIAASFGVFVLDNLEAGLDTQIQFGSPFIGQLGPAIRYIYPVTDEFHPYLGGFYRHWFIGDNIDDVDALGVRGGLMIAASKVFFQIGVVYQAIVSECEGDGCTEVYPEFGVSILL